MKSGSQNDINKSQHELLCSVTFAACRAVVFLSSLLMHNPLVVFQILLALVRQTAKALHPLLPFRLMDELHVRLQRNISRRHNQLFAADRARDFLLEIFGVM